MPSAWDLLHNTYICTLETGRHTHPVVLFSLSFKAVSGLPVPSTRSDAAEAIMTFIAYRIDRRPIRHERDSTAEPCLAIRQDQLLALRSAPPGSASRRYPSSRRAMTGALDHLRWPAPAQSYVRQTFARLPYVGRFDIMSILNNPLGDGYASGRQSTGPLQDGSSPVSSAALRPRLSNRCFLPSTSVCPRPDKSETRLDYQPIPCENKRLARIKRPLRISHRKTEVLSRNRPMLLEPQSVVLS